MWVGRRINEQKQVLELILPHPKFAPPSIEQMDKQKDIPSQSVAKRATKDYLWLIEK